MRVLYAWCLKESKPKAEALIGERESQESGVCVVFPCTRDTKNEKKAKPPEKATVDEVRVEDGEA